MRVLVLVPTTGSLNRVLRLEAYPGLAHSFAVRQGDIERLPITKRYADLTLEGGPLVALGPPVKPGQYRLWLAGPIDTGESWELPVLLAHLVVALGHELAEEPAKADIVLWSTGAVDVDLAILDRDYKLAAKLVHSRAGLQDAAAAGAQVIVLLPAGAAGDDAPRLRGLLSDVGAQNARVEIVDRVAAARRILEQALGHAAQATRGRPLLFAAASDPLPAGGKTGTRGLFWKIPALLAAGAAMALLAFIAGSGLIPWLLGHSIPGRTAGTIEKTGLGKTSGTGTGRLPDRGLEKGADKGIDKAAERSTESADSNAPERQDRSGTGAAPPPREVILPVVAPPLPPVKLEELRAPNDGRNNGSCFPVLVEHRPPSRVEVALDPPDRFRDSAGLNLCGLEWSLSPEAAQSGVQGFDIDLPADRYGARLTRTGAPGAWTKITIEFTRDLRDFRAIIAYNVKLTFASAPLPEQVQRFRHVIN